VVESDESTANFDEIFTSANLHEVGLVDMDLDIDEEDPSEDWVALAGSVTAHQPNGPLGSERGASTPVSPAPLSPTPQNSTSASRNGTNGAAPPPRPQGIDIKPKKKTEAVGSPLTNSVQENFRGFTYSGGESVVAPNGILAMRAATKTPESEREGDDSAGGTEDEFEDPTKPAGRYAHKRRKGLGFTGLDDDM
jgi:hypothetical protein